MRGSVVFRVLRGLVYRTAWVLLYISHLALVVVASAMFFWVAVIAVDSNGGLSRLAGQPVTLAQRYVMGLFYGLLGLASAVGSLTLRRCHQRMNPLYPEMQISLHADRPEVCERPTSSPMYDRDLDEVL